MTIYDFNVELSDGSTYSLDKYRNHPVIIVNTATKCGLAPQFEQLEELYKKYQDQGLVVLGFPSNQFKQENLDGAGAAESCRMTYGVTFPMHEVGDVNGDNAQPLFNYLTEAAPGTLGNKIKWNFTKFLISPDGSIVTRFGPQTNPLNMTEAIEKYLYPNCKNKFATFKK